MRVAGTEARKRSGHLAELSFYVLLRRQRARRRRPPLLPHAGGPCCLRSLLNACPSQMEACHISNSDIAFTFKWSCNNYLCAIFRNFAQAVDEYFSIRQGVIMLSGLDSRLGNMSTIVNTTLIDGVPHHDTCRSIFQSYFSIENIHPLIPFHANTFRFANSITDWTIPPSRLIFY